MAINANHYRRRLPDKRAAATKKFQVGTWELYLTVGFYDNMQPGEVFVKIAKQGSVIAGLINGATVLASLLLQQGVPWEKIADKWEHTSFEPADDTYRSLLDAIAREVREVVSEFGGSTDNGYEGPAGLNGDDDGDEPTPQPAAPKAPSPAPAETAEAETT